jgi:hypothetical protein
LLFDRIESPSFSVQVTVCSGLSTVLTVLEEDATVAELIGLLQESVPARQEVAKRIMMLLRSNPFTDRLSPYDEALTVYLYALHAVNPDGIEEICQRIASQPDLFWARRLAAHYHAAAKPRTRE